VHDRYIEFAKRTLPRDLSLDGLRVVVDCANGAAYKVCRKRCGSWRRRGADRRRARRLQHQQGLRLDLAEALSKKVREMRADIGIALDATPTASSWSTSAAMSSTATSSRGDRAELEGDVGCRARHRRTVMSISGWSVS